jgi:hypothetical protein
MRTSLSMTAVPDVVPVPITENDTTPLGYLYADSGACDHKTPDIDMGYYDPDTQTWVDPAGFITAGVYTKTRCPCGCGYKTDDACM